MLLAKGFTRISSRSTGEQCHTSPISSTSHNVSRHHSPKLEHNVIMPCDSMTLSCFSICQELLRKLSSPRRMLPQVATPSTWKVPRVTQMKVKFILQPHDKCYPIVIRTFSEIIYSTHISVAKCVIMTYCYWCKSVCPMWQCDMWFEDI